MTALGLRNPLDFKASSVFDVLKKMCAAASFIPLAEGSRADRIAYNIETSLFNEAEYRKTYLD